MNTTNDIDDLLGRLGTLVEDYDILYDKCNYLIYNFDETAAEVQTLEEFLDLRWKVIHEAERERDYCADAIVRIISLWKRERKGAIQDAERS